MAITPSIVSASDIKINALIYGLQGTGKTTLAASAQDHPEMAPVLVLNLEGGLLSIAGRGDIHAVEIRSIADLEEVYQGLLGGSEEFAPYRTIIIDSGSEMYQLSLREAVAASIARDRKVGKHKDRSPDDIWLEDYGTAGAQMGRLFRGLRDLDRHTIITALLRNEYADQEKRVLVEARPDFSESLARHIMGFQDFVWYMFLDDEGNRNLLTRPKGVYRAKTRGPRFAEAIGEVVKNPSLPNLYDTLMQTEGNGVE